MKKKELLQRITALEDRVRELEARPYYYSYYPYWQYIPQPWKPWYPSYGSGTGDPMPEPTKIWCSSSGECSNGS